MAQAPLVACRHCGTVHADVPLAPGDQAQCSVCGGVLYRQSRLGVDGWLALAVAALLAFAVAAAFPIVGLTIQGKTVHASMTGALWLSWRQGHELLAVLTGLFGFWLPLGQLLLQAWALWCLRRGRLPADFALGMRLLRWLSPWSMIPVLMLGILVALVKFGIYARVEPGPGLWAYAALTFLLTGLGRLGPEKLYRMAEQAGLVPRSGDAVGRLDTAASCETCGHVQPDAGTPAACARCGALVHRRRPAQSARVWALWWAAALAYLPANLLPMMQVQTLRGEKAHTILGGVLELWRLGSWDLAVIVFVASVVVPVTKLAVLAALMLQRRWRGLAAQRQRTRLYGAVEFIGLWSMLDVFVVILMIAMADFPGLSKVTAGPGAASFGMVVVLTMLAAMAYDPRSGWDQRPRAQEGGLQSPSPKHPCRTNA